MIEQYYKDNYERLIKTIFWRVDRNRHIAEEVVQEAFTRALVFQEGFDIGVQEFGAWFHTILNNCARDAMRAERNRGMSLDDVQEILPAEAEDESISITKVEILSRIEAMKEGTTKNVVRLHFKEGMEPRHICEQLKLPSNGYIRFIISTWRKNLIEEYE